MFDNEMGELIKQAKEMQEKVKQAQEEVSQIEVMGESGGGLVKVWLDGNYGTRRVEIDDEVAKGEKAMLEDLVAAAFNDAVRKLEKEKTEKVSKLTSGFNLPAGMKMPF